MTFQVELHGNEPWFRTTARLDPTATGGTYIIGGDGSRMEMAVMWDDTMAAYTGCQSHFDGVWTVMEAQRCVLPRGHESPHLAAMILEHPGVDTPTPIVFDLTIRSPLP